MSWSAVVIGDPDLHNWISASLRVKNLQTRPLDLLNRRFAWALLEYKIEFFTASWSF
jgi:hypothetical protein